MLKSKIHFFGAWFLIHILISIIVAWIVTEIKGASYFRVLPVAFIKVNFISGFASIAGYTIGRKLHDRSYFIIYSMVITASLAGACTGMLAGDGLLYFLFNERKFVLDSFTLTVLPVMTITISILAASIDILMSQREKYKTQAAVLSEKNKMKNLVFKEKGSLIKVNPAEIVYVASSAKKTVIHSIKQDIEIGNLMKAVEAILPAKIFLRIHKQFIINTDYISRFVHIKSGLYEVLLNDDDETVLPVGRKYSSRVRNFMSSHMHVPGP